VVNKIVTKPLRLNLFHRQIPGKLIDESGDHLDVCEFLCAYIGKQTFDTRIRCAVTLTEVSEGGSEFTVRTA
jgi:hypothetical protein